MKVIRGIEVKQENREEVLSDVTKDFPYIASYVELDHYLGRQCPWHWHKETELFYILEGEVEYDTTQGVKRFPAGSGGMVNANVLHKTRAGAGEKTVTAMLHLFDPVLISGSRGSAIDQKYVLPLLTASGIDIISLHPDQPEQAQVLEVLRRSFQLSEESFGYELSLRSILSELWGSLFQLAGPMRKEKGGGDRVNEKIKKMLVYVQEHLAEKIAVEELAAAAFISTRECFRIFQKCLRTTPAEYIIGCRVRAACRLLAETDEAVTRIGQTCGLGSSSYFSKTFRDKTGCSPTQYRQKWQDSDKNGRQ